MRIRTEPGHERHGDIKRPALGDPIFVYDGGPGLVTHLEGWALSMIELLFGDGLEATRKRMVAVYRTPDGELDIAASVVALAAAEAAWHLVSPDGNIVNGGPRGHCGSLPSQTRTELEAFRDSGRYKSHIGAVAVYGIPGTAQRTSSANDHDIQPRTGAGFTAARGGQYRWYDPEQ